MLIKFEYDKFGFGDLIIYGESDSLILSVGARTGSLDSNRALINAIPLGDWYIVDDPVDTDEKAMLVNGKTGKKVRLYRKDDNSNGFIYTHYLIHYDGNLPGSAGCIVIIDSRDYHAFFTELIEAKRIDGTIKLIVTKKE